MKIFVSDLKDGDSLKDEVFSIEEIQHHTTRTGNPYFRVVLQDRTGEMVGKIWQDDFPNCQLKNVQAGDVVKIDAEVSTYNDQLQVIIRRLFKTDDFDIADLLQSSERNLDEMFTEIIEIIGKIKDKNIKKLLQGIFKDQSFVNRFKRTPAAERVHHDFIGGLMEHILEMVNISKAIMKNYPEANKDIVLAGVILHDIGKVFELEVQKTALKRTLEGKLIGHLVQGIQFVQKKLPKDFPKDIRLKIEHIIVSHHHKIDLEYGSPAKQQTIEAAIVHVADYSSSHVRQFQKAIKLGEGSEPGFSDYQKWIETQVYLD